MNAGNLPPSASGGAARSPQARCRLAIVEPDWLTRWSLSVYLEHAFNVVAVESASEARQLLESTPMDAIVISDDLADNGADRIETLARSRNTSLTVVRTVTAKPDAAPPNAVCLEKPFRLSAMARLLGVASEPTT